MKEDSVSAKDRAELSLLGIVLVSEGEAASALIGEDVERLVFRDVTALVRPVQGADRPLQTSEVLEHHSALERVLKDRSVLPAQPGIVFFGKPALMTFLEERYLSIKEAFDAIAGRWEFRLDLRGEPGAVDEIGAAIYQELRQRAHLSMPLRRSDPGIYPAGFLIERAGTRLFKSRVAELSAENEEITTELVGPLPPYDFVKITA